MKLSRSAFSLIECVLALGVASSLLLTMIALLPGGLDSVRVASRSSVESAIIERLRHQHQADLTLPMGELFFDEDGTALPTKSASAAFAVRVESLPGALLPGDESALMRRLRISIADLTVGEILGTGSRARSFHLLLAPPQGGLP